MFGKKNKKDELNFETENYIMPEYFDKNKLVVANLEQVTNQNVLPYVLTTSQKYIFEVINEKEKVRYKEVFTGFITDNEDSQHYFNYPYPVNITPLREVLPSIREDIPKFSFYQNSQTT